MAENNSMKAPLEKTIEREYTLREKVLQGIRGYGVPILGGMGGYLIVNDPIGVSGGVVLTALIMRELEVRSFKTIPRIAEFGYITNMAVGASTGIMRLAYWIFS